MSNELLKALVVTLATLSDESLNKVKEFTEKLIASILPTKMTLGNRTYEILGFLEGDEKFVNGNTMVERAKKMNANLGEKEGRHILKHQDEIPTQLREKIFFIFTDWRHPDISKSVAFVYWCGGSWVQSWNWIDYDWSDSARVLRCK